MIKIFAVDDSDEYLDSLEQFFKPFSAEYPLVGTYSDVTDADGLEDLDYKIESLNPDVVLMDFSFVLKNRPDDFGIELCKRILKISPSTKVIMLVGDDHDTDDRQMEKIKRSFMADASGYLRKREPQTWFEGIRETINGHLYINKEISKIIIGMIKIGRSLGLSSREVELLHHLANDKTVSETAKAMGIGYDGANFHVGNVKIKLQVSTLQGLTAKACRYGII